MYHTCFVDAISFTMHRNNELLDSIEKEYLSSVLTFHTNQGIEHCAVTLLSRMFLRRNDWMKSSSFRDYLRYSSQENISGVDMDKNESTEQVCIKCIKLILPNLAIEKWVFMHTGACKRCTSFFIP